MARIIYGVCGEGFGHSSRAREVLAHLKSKGHDMIVIGYSKSYKALKNEFDVVRIHGLHILYEKNMVNHLKTIMHNIRRYKKFRKSFVKLDKLFQQFKPDIAFSDFEPLTGLLANVHRVPLISIDNQHGISGMKISYPRKYRKDAITTIITINSMLWNAKAYLALTFFFGKVKRKKTFLFKPIIRKEVLVLKPKQKDFILVYQTSKSNKKLLRTLKDIDEKFIVYGFGISKRDKNLQFKKHSREDFLNDLKNCKAVIMNGGFSLMSEAIYLKKPILSEPVQKQFEQIINAIHLGRLGYGKHEDILTAEKIRKFIKDIPKYKANLKKYRQRGNEEILRKVDSLVRHYSN